jgi:hypothetical protein
LGCCDTHAWTAAGWSEWLGDDYWAGRSVVALFSDVVSRCFQIEKKHSGYGRRLVEAQAVMGFRSHDVRLVAAMQSYGVKQLLTFNATHYRGLPITVVDPFQFKRVVS